MGVLMTTPRRRSLTKTRHELVFGHNLKTIIAGVVRMCYPRDVKHLRYKIRSDHNARTSNAYDKKRYRIIESVHIGVKLPYDHRRTSDRNARKCLLTSTVDDNGNVNIEKIR